MGVREVEFDEEQYVRDHPEILDLLVPKLTKYIPYEPHEKQAAFLLLENKDALFGGAAGGGKSDALLMAALQHVDTPGYAALIVRRTYAELSKPGALLSRARTWLGPTDAHWNGETHTWTFPSGASLSFGYLANEGDRDQYQSAEYQFVGVDEITEFPEPRDPIFLFSRLRRLKTSRIPIRFRSASNPIGKGAQWVYDRYIRYGKSYRNPISGLTEPKIFAPSFLSDNPALDADEYLLSLAELDTLTREALIKGIWGLRPPGKYFQRRTIDRILRKDLPPLAELVLVRWTDLASSEKAEGTDPDYTASVLLGYHEEQGLSYVIDARRGHFRPSNVERFLAENAKADAALVGGNKGKVRQALPQDPGAAGKIVSDHVIRRVLQGYAVETFTETGSKEDRARPVSAQSDRGNLVVVEADWNDEFFDEIESFPDGAHEDWVDALSGAYALAVSRGGKITKGKRLWG